MNRLLTDDDVAALYEGIPVRPVCFNCGKRPPLDYRPAAEHIWMWICCNGWFV